jgi:hypothetical protein
MKTIAEQLNITEFPFEIRDKKGNQIYCEDKYNFWAKREFDENGNRIYCETSYGRIVDNRQEYTMEELTKILGKPFKLVK